MLEDEPETKRIKTEPYTLEDINETEIQQQIIKKPKKSIDERSRNCPYLDTINRSILDFDFEKLCSVSLSKINVYACLVCGKYFQGRGIGTHVYTHSVAVDHHVFLNLSTLKFYCLPDNYEVIDSSLDDITYVLKPTFTKQNVNQIDSNEKLSRAYDGSTYLPGIVGLNNIKANDYCNVILQSLSHVPLIRDYFLQEKNYSHIANLKSKDDQLFQLAQCFGELIRKLWNPKNFKAHVSPHEMLQSVVLCSKKQFQITKQGDPILFLSWFLNSLNSSLKHNKSTKTIIEQTFQGTMKVYSRKVIPIDKSIDEKLQLMLKDEYKEESNELKFFYLTLDLPASPLFRDELRENIIPQIPLYTLLNKFNGQYEKEYKTYKDSYMKRFELIHLPKYLILYVKRFNKNTFFIEKNPTIVNFPINNVDLSDYLSNGEQKDNRKCLYDLIANIVHDGEPDKGNYRVHILHRGTGKWFELQDLHVSEILPQMITLSESYIQIWQMQD